MFDSTFEAVFPTGFQMSIETLENGKRNVIWC